MTRYRVFISALVILVGAVAILARPGSTAASKPSTSIPVGYVDMDEVGEKSVVGQNAKKEATALKTKLEDGLVKRQQLALLTPDQQKELEALQKKTTTTDAEKAKIAELTGIGEKLNQDLLDLQQKPNPSEADKAKINELSNRFSAARQALANEKQAAQDELDRNMGQLLSGLQEKIMKAVADVAKERGLAMVVHKEARLFGGEDITDEVISRLKK